MKLIDPQVSFDWLNDLGSRASFWNSSALPNMMSVLRLADIIFWIPKCLPKFSTRQSLGSSRLFSVRAGNTDNHNYWDQADHSRPEQAILTIIIIGIGQIIIGPSRIITSSLPAGLGAPKAKEWFPGPRQVQGTGLDSPTKLPRGLLQLLLQAQKGCVSPATATSIPYFPAPYGHGDIF